MTNQAEREREREHERRRRCPLLQQEEPKIRKWTRIISQIIRSSLAASRDNALAAPNEIIIQAALFARLLMMINGAGWCTGRS